MNKAPRRKNLDGIIVFKQVRIAKERTRLFFNVHKKLFSALVFSTFSLIISLPILSAFEAHVVNVTAKIDPPKMCDAKSKGFWANHEGCKKGGGTSVWAAEVNALSAGYSGVFAASTGENMCADIWTPNCPSGNTVEAALCKAKTHPLADELNVVSGRLQLDAFIAGADDGSQAFSFLGLSPLSNINDALSAIEAVLADPGSNAGDIKRAGHVAQRIYAFYEEENPFHPDCITDPEDIPECINAPKRGDIKVENENEADIENEVEVESNTGGNSASAAGEGDGGTVTTGNATSTASLVNEVNENITEITDLCEEDCGDVLGTSTTNGKKDKKDVEAENRGPQERRERGDEGEASAEPESATSTPAILPPPPPPPPPALAEEISVESATSTENAIE